MKSLESRISGSTARISAGVLQRSSRSFFNALVSHRFAKVGKQSSACIEVNAWSAARNLAHTFRAPESCLIAPRLRIVQRLGQLHLAVLRGARKEFHLKLDYGREPWVNGPRPAHPVPGHFLRARGRERGRGRGRRRRPHGCRRGLPHAARAAG